MMDDRRINWSDEPCWRRFVRQDLGLDLDVNLNGNAFSLYLTDIFGPIFWH